MTTSLNEVRSRLRIDESTVRLSDVTRPLHLLPKSELVKTSAVDRAEWNYGGLLGFVSRQRFRLVLSLLPAPRMDRVLEIGYGSGVFMPELVSRAAHVAGIDVHDRASEVMDSLARSGITADLACARAEVLPYATATFDAVVAVSTLEFVTDIHAVLSEISRVLRPNGRAIVVTPANNPLLDLAFRLATGASARRDFGDRRQPVVAALNEMHVVATAQFPRWSPLPIYRAFAFGPSPSKTEQGEFRQAH